MMNFTNEMIEKAKTAASAEELLKLAEEDGIELTAEEAEKYFSFLSADGELPDEALEAVAGGKNYTASFNIGHQVQFWYPPESSILVGEITGMITCRAKGWWEYHIKLTVGNMKGQTLRNVPLEDPSYQAQRIA